MAAQKCLDVCDVLVIGAGLAGTTAALAAAQRGSRVALASSGPTFSGSSNFGGTWGLGLVGPRDAGDVDDLVASVLSVGRAMADPVLARVLVEGVPAAVAELEARGVELRRAERPDERDFIPCFDSRCRSWHGIGRASWREATGRALDAGGVRRLPGHDLVDLVRDDEGAVCGAVLLDRGIGAFRRVAAGAVVLATGGFGGLFERTLTMPDVSGTAAAVALEAGARLVNVEFIQIMPGLVAPVKNVVFNERTFRYARVEGVGGPDERELLAQRAAHGPFTASLPDRAVDLALAAAGPEGAAVSYELPGRLPEFMQTYFDWFSASFGRPASEGLRIVPYAHASNGGILVDERGWTGVEGLFACGEATGGMHGADRIGGLASANALVFGGIAGRAAAERAAGRDGVAPDGAIPREAAGGAVDAVREIRRLMDRHCLVVRDAEGLLACQARLCKLEEQLRRDARPCDDEAAVSATTRAHQALLSARALVAAMLARRESRGAHYRADFPTEDPGQARPLAVFLEGATIRVAPQKGLA